MDPTIDLCLVRNSFKSVQPKPLYPSSFKLEYIPPFNVDVKLISKDENLPPIYVDLKKYSRLNQIKDEYGKIDGKQFSIIRAKANPFEFLGCSIFGNRAAVKLSNIDAIYNLTQHLGGYINFTTPGRFVYADLAGGPGSFTQYIQWRRPDSIGFGITLKNPVGGEKEKLDWDYTIIDQPRFHPYYGEDNSGNLYTNYEGFVNYVKESNNTDLFLVTADGGFNVEDTNDYARQEFISSRLILTECLTAVMLLNQGGSFVCKVFDTVTKISADTIYMMSCCFDELIMFKPVSSRPANSERYLICRGRKSSVQIQPYIESMRMAVKLYTDKMMVSSFIDKLPEEFTNWLIQSNDESMDRQIKTGENIIKISKGEKVILVQYDIHKCFQYWKIPDNRERFKSYQ